MFAQGVLSPLAFVRIDGIDLIVHIVFQIFEENLPKNVIIIMNDVNHSRVFIYFTSSPFAMQV